MHLTYKLPYCIRVFLAYGKRHPLDLDGEQQ